MSAKVIQKAARATRHASTHKQSTVDNTAERLIEVAIGLFATRGLSGTTIRDLAEAAEVNVAAVHYHFGGKEQLYAAAVHRVFEGMLDLRELLERELESAKSAGSSEAVVHSLARAVRGLLSILFRQGRISWGGAYLQRETIEPTPAMQHVIEAFIRPAWNVSQALIELLRPDLAGTEAIPFISSSILGQCLYYQQNLPVVLATHGISEVSELFLERIARHVTEFSLAAIMNSQREKIEK